MNRTASILRALSCILCVLLLAAAVGTICGCEKKQPPHTEYENVTEVGEGGKQFIFTVTDRDGNETAFLIHTDRQKVGEALLDAGLIEGDEGPYGLYVKKVIGISAIYEEDGDYWAFYENGQYAAGGVDMTDITPDAVYGFRIEK